MIRKTGRKDRRTTREMKQEEDLHSIILITMHVQCNAKLIGLMSMVNAH